MNKSIFQIIIKDGEIDFSICGLIEELSHKQYEELKSMLITAIGTMEIMRRNSQKENSVKERNVR